MPFIELLRKLLYQSDPLFVVAIEEGGYRTTDAILLEDLKGRIAPAEKYVVHLFVQTPICSINAKLLLPEVEME